MREKSVLDIPSYRTGVYTQVPRRREDECNRDFATASALWRLLVERSRKGIRTHSTVDVADHPVRDFPKSNLLHWAGRSKCLDLNMAIGKELDFVVSAWT